MPNSPRYFNHGEASDGKTNHRETAPDIAAILACSSAKDLLKILTTSTENNWFPFLRIAKFQTEELENVLAKMQEILTPEQIFDVFKQTTNRGWNAFMLLMTSDAKPAVIEEALNALLSVASNLEPEAIKELMEQQSTQHKNALLYTAHYHPELLQTFLVKLEERLSKNDFRYIATLEMDESKESLLDHKLAAFEEDILTGFNPANMMPILIYAIRHCPDQVERILAEMKDLEIEDWNEVFAYKEKRGVELLTLAFHSNHEAAVVPLFNALALHSNIDQRHRDGALHMACRSMPQYLPPLFETIKNEERTFFLKSMFKEAILQERTESIRVTGEILKANYPQDQYKDFFTGDDPLLCLAMKLQPPMAAILSLKPLIAIIKTLPPKEQANIFECGQPLSWINETTLNNGGFFTSVASDLVKAMKDSEVIKHLSKDGIDALNQYKDNVDYYYPSARDSVSSCSMM